MSLPTDNFISFVFKTSDNLPPTVLEIDQLAPKCTPPVYRITGYETEINLYMKNINYVKL